MAARESTAPPATDADLEDAQLAVFVGLRPRTQRERGESGGNDRAGLQKVATADGRE